MIILGPTKIQGDTLTHAVGIQGISMYFVAKSVLTNLPFGADPEKEQHEQARVKAAANLRRLDRSRDDSEEEDDSSRRPGNGPRTRKEELVLDQYESQIAMEVVAPEDIPVGFDGVYTLRNV